MKLDIYTDGACLGDPGEGPGGWGFSITGVDQEFTYEDKGADPHTTCNRMELMAVLRALKSLHPLAPMELTVYSDSQYVIKGVTEWRPKWEGRNWRTIKKTPVKNMELWKELFAIVDECGHQISWQWVKGHSGIPGNEKADQLARMAISTLPRRSYL